MLWMNCEDRLIKLVQDNVQWRTSNLAALKFLVLSACCQAHPYITFLILIDLRSDDITAAKSLRLLHQYYRNKKHRMTTKLPTKTHYYKSTIR